MRKVKDDGEECEMLERAMEYAGMVGVELADMLTAVHKKVRALELQVPNQHMFRGDGLQNFIQDHQDQSLGARGGGPGRHTAGTSQGYG